MGQIKKVLKELIPPYLIKMAKELFSDKHRWIGHYKSWEKAQEVSVGYNSNEIFEKVRSSALKVKNGEFAFERDSILFTQPHYSFPLLASILWTACNNFNNLKLLDYGGSLGSTYFLYKDYLKDMAIHWNIIEQPEFVIIGKKEFETDILKFYNSVDELAIDDHYSVLFSNSLQYLSEPLVILDKIFRLNCNNVILDKTLFSNKFDHFISIQKVPRSIYNTSIPCWIFNKNKILNLFMKNGYKMQFEFPAEFLNKNIFYSGFLFIKNSSR